MLLVAKNIKRPSTFSVDGLCNTISNLNYLSLNWKAPPFGVADYVIFDLENHIIPSHIDLHIKNFKAAP